ncbi:MAG: hypothetical protein IRY99_19190 [Isosphaeraceae bacterium]|nr:hypothetical protein [Isosphaeraceae bacterium]
MVPGDLELYSTQELIDELLRRTTFQGVIVRSRDEAKNREWSGERVFTVSYNANLEREEVSRLLGIVSEHLDRNWA